MKRYRTILVTAALSLLLLPACERENLLGTIRDSVSFAVTVEEGVATKAAPDVLPCTSVDDAGTGNELFLTMEEAPFPASISAAPATKPTVVNRKDFENNPSLGLVAYAYSASGAAPGDGWVVKTSKLSPPHPEVILPGMIPLYQDTPGSEGSLRPDGSSKWIPLHPDRLLWPGEGYVRYFAVAPYMFVRSTLTGDTGIVEVVAQDGSAPKVNYTVPAPVADQVDLLVSTPSSTKEYSGDPGWRKIDVPMQLVHAMTGIRFRLPEGLTIDELKIENVYGKGTLDLTSSPLAWSPTGSADASYSLANLSTAGGRGLTTDEDKPGYNVTDAASIFYLLPQVLPSGAKITVTLSMKEGATTVAGSERTITADISGQEWKLGTLVTYTITHDGTVYVLNAPDLMVFSYTGGTSHTRTVERFEINRYHKFLPEYISGVHNDFQVQSYKIVKGTKTGVDWKMQFKQGDNWVDLTDANLPAMFYSLPSGGAHASSGESWLTYAMNLKATPAEPIAWNAHTLRLRNSANRWTAEEGGDTPQRAIDLSMYATPMGEGIPRNRARIEQTTANCYVVDRPGWYKIPMVYGNAIDGMHGKPDNEAAYKYNSFYGHSGRINQPWVSVAFDITSVELMWQDVAGLVSQVSATGSGQEERYIVFYVDPDNIHQGNALIAAKAGGTVAWSWHIWVTDYDFTPRPVATEPDQFWDVKMGAEVFELMPMSLGWSDGHEDKEFKERKMTLRLVQLEEGAVVGRSKEIEILQMADEEYAYSYYSAGYQWGRKDPLVILTTPSDLYRDKRVFFTGLGYNYASEFFEAKAMGSEESSLKEYVKNPASRNVSDNAAMYVDISLWSVGGYQNGWYSYRPFTVKTVYDPSPVGWCVPPPQFSSGFEEKTGGDNTIRGTRIPSTEPSIDVMGYNLETGFLAPDGTKLYVPFRWCIGSYACFWTTGIITSGSSGRRAYMGFRVSNNTMSRNVDSPDARPGMHHSVQPCYDGVFGGPYGSLTDYEVVTPPNLF